MKSKTCNLKVSIIAITCSCMAALALAIGIVPMLLKKESTIHVNGMYPDYSFEELKNESKIIEWCRLSQIEPSRITQNDIGYEIITTDYIFTSLENNKTFVLRIEGGTVDHVTTVNYDEVGSVLTIGNDYVLFLSSPFVTQVFSVSTNNSDFTFSEYYLLMTGKTSVFQLSQSEFVDGKEMVKSADGKYQEEKQEVIKIASEK